MQISILDTLAIESNLHNTLQPAGTGFSRGTYDNNETQVAEDMYELGSLWAEKCSDAIF